LNSTNGVQVNGRKITRHLLTDGDVLTVGEIQFRCVLKFKAPEEAVEQARPVQAPGGAQAAPIAVTNLSDLRPGDAPKGEPRG
jgi:hypothetical protein